jgi:hypothetical protein
MVYYSWVGIGFLIRYWFGIFLGFFEVGLVFITGFSVYHSIGLISSFFFHFLPSTDAVSSKEYIHVGQAYRIVQTQSVIVLYNN